MVSLLHRIVFRLRTQLSPLPQLRRFGWQLLGARLGSGMPQGVRINWPHQVQIGRDSVLENDIQFKYSAPWRPGPSIVVGDRVFLGRGCEFNCIERIELGDDCLIGSGCKFIDANHGMAPGALMREQAGTSAPIRIGRDVWLGVNVVVLKGVEIGDGAVIAAGAVVNRSVPAGEIWGGIPARRLGERTN